MGKGADGGVSLDTGYISSIHGILQIIEIILSFIVIICTAVNSWTLYLGGGWALFVAIVAVIIVSLLFALNVFHLRDRFGAQFSMVELIICGVFALFYLIAFIIEAVNASKWHVNADIAAAVFCALAFIAFLIHLILHLKRWRFSFSSSSTTATTTTTTTTTSAKA